VRKSQNNVCHKTLITHLHRSLANQSRARHAASASRAERRARIAHLAERMNNKRHFLLVPHADYSLWNRVRFCEIRAATSGLGGFLRRAIHPSIPSKPVSPAAHAQKQSAHAEESWSSLLTSTNNQANRTNQPINNNERFVYNSVHNEFAQMPLA
jgi:hypothetical protein